MSCGISATAPWSRVTEASAAVVRRCRPIAPAHGQIGSWKKSMPNTCPGAVYFRTAGSVEYTTKQDGGSAGTIWRGHLEKRVRRLLCKRLSSLRIPRIAFKRSLVLGALLGRRRCRQSMSSWIALGRRRCQHRSGSGQSRGSVDHTVLWPSRIKGQPWSHGRRFSDARGHRAGAAAKTSTDRRHAWWRVRPHCSRSLRSCRLYTSRCRPSSL